MKIVWDHERGGYRKRMTWREKGFAAATAIAVAGLIWNFYANDTAYNTPAATIEVADPFDDLIAEKAEAVLPAPAQPKEATLVIPVTIDHDVQSTDVRGDRREVQNSGQGDSIRVERSSERTDDLQPCKDLPDPTSANPPRARPHAAAGKHSGTVVAKVHKRPAVQAHGGNPSSHSRVRCLDRHTWDGSIPATIHSQTSRGPPVV